MKRILGILLSELTFTFISHAQLNLYDSKWVTDTLIFNNREIALSLPEKSIELSTEQIFKGEGKSLIYPLQVSLTKEGQWNIETLVIEQIVTTSYKRMIANSEIDDELWNTFNQDYEGSRCYVLSGKYSRIDILSSGLVVVYENLSQDMAEIANRIISTIHTIDIGRSSLKESKRKRGVQIIE